MIVSIHLIHILHGSFDQHAGTLRTVNSNPAGIFVTLNETDGQGRKAANIKSVRAVFADLDGADLEPLKEFNPYSPTILLCQRPALGDMFFSGSRIGKFRRILASRSGSM